MTTSLVDSIRLLQRRRAQCVSEIAQIDSELEAARTALGLPQLGLAPSDGELSHHRKCERCGNSFLPAIGVSSRFCSRQCYAGDLSIERRRELILDRLIDGPKFAASIRTGELADVSASTIQNDLYYLSRNGRVERVDDGWALATADATFYDPETERENDVEEPDGETVPLERGTTTLSSQTSLTSSAH